MEKLFFLVNPDAIVLAGQVGDQGREGGGHIVQPFTIAFFDKCLAQMEKFWGKMPDLW